MDIINTLLPLLLSSLIGLSSYIRGLNEHFAKSRSNVLVGGVRTFFLLSLAGLISGNLITAGYLWIALLLSISSIALILIFYAVTVDNHENYSLADELSAIIIHLLSICWVLHVIPQNILIAAYIGIIFILEQKEALLSLREKVNAKELSQIVIFLATALIILPFLPQHTYSLAELGIDPQMFGIQQTTLDTLVHIELINPYKLWFIVVLVSGIDVVGYLLKKAFSGQASILLSSLIGGFVSSTSTTIRLAAKSKQETDYTTLVTGAIVANIISFFQLLILIAPISLAFLRVSFPIVLGMAAAGILAILVLNLKFKNTGTLSQKVESPAKEAKYETPDAHVFHLDQAIKFAILLTLVKIVANVALVFLGSSGFIITSMVASLSGVDAVVITLAELVQKGTISGQLPLIVFALTNAVNLISKIVYSIGVGHKEFAIRFGFSSAAMIIAAVITALVV